MRAEFRIRDLQFNVAVYANAIHSQQSNNNNKVQIHLGNLNPNTKK